MGAERVRTLVREHHTFSRYFIVGILAFVIDALVFLLTRNLLDLSLARANILGMLTGLVFSFTLNHAWVFSRDFSPAKSTLRFVIFVINSLFVLAVSTWLIVLLENISTPLGHDKLREMGCKVISMIFVVAWNYTVYSRVIFKHRGHDEQAPSIGI